MTEEVKQPETQPGAQPEQPSMASRLKALLRDFPTSPTTEEIEGWKTKYGDIFVSAFSEDELFVFRPLNRREHRELQESAQSEQDFEEKCVRRALLWTSVADLEQKAGTIPTLFEQIVQSSNFMAPQLAASLVVKL